MKNPLRKRILRELKEEWSKYLAIFLLMVLTISFGSGFLISADSMIAAYNNSFEDYSVEWGHFAVKKKMNKAQWKQVQNLGVDLYELYYAEEMVAPGDALYGAGMDDQEAQEAGLDTSTLRIYAERDQVDRVCLMEGSMPEKAGEIAIDRMYADNNDIVVGDTIASSNHCWTVTGLVALSDYSSLFAKNSDTMFDSDKFGVAVVTEEEFAAIDSEELTWNYAWVYQNPPADEAEENTMATDLQDDLNGIVSLTDYVPRYLCQAIQFTGDDFGSDRGMMIVMVYMVIAIIAFVFGITTSNTIQKEANVIGTLRASGYTKGELIRHYMTTPLLVTLVSSILGNIIGYTWMKDFCAAMYYGSYSLPTFVTLWNANAFLMTTLIPLALMIIVTFLMLARALSLSPLKFIRRDLSRKKNGRAFPLNVHIPFFSRFRIRVILQNMPNYILMFVGILFANLLLLFGMALPNLLACYQESVTEHMISNYQYILTIPVGVSDSDGKLSSLLTMLQFEREVETDNETAEKFSAYSLKTLGDLCPAEEVTFYGVAPDSRFVKLTSEAGTVSISSSYADKYQLEIGDMITLKEPYESTTYDFAVGGIYDYEGAVCVFMDQTELNRTFDMDDEMFSGYFSDTPITDISAEYIGTTIDYDAVTKISRQLTISMGSMMYLLDAFAVLIFLAVIFVMSKIIIEKNAQSISMAKILGYSNGEISRLYIVSTSIVVVLEFLISIPIVAVGLEYVYRIAIVEFMTGWIMLRYENIVYAEMLALGIGSYAVIALLEMRRIRKVPMDQALKNVE